MCGLGAVRQWGGVGWMQDLAEHTDADAGHPVRDNVLFKECHAVRQDVTVHDARGGEVHSGNDAKNTTGRRAGKSEMTAV